MTENPTKLVILDRDGVINENVGYVTDPKQWVWCEHAPEALRDLVWLGYQSVLVTNQSGVGRGFFTVRDFYSVMDAARADMAERLGAADYWPSLVCACFHRPSDRCACRKPRTGAWLHIEHAFGPVDRTGSWFVDDKAENLAFADTLGIPAVHISPQGNPPAAFPSLSAFVAYLAKEHAA